MKKSEKKQVHRCGWCGEDPLYQAYHDTEWGRPVRDDRKLFEMLVLEGMQAGLSWLTILRKREAFRKAFDEFDPQKIALYGEDKIETLLQEKGIIRNRRKLVGAVQNANAFLAVQKKYGSFAQFLWAYVDNVPVMGNPKSLEELPVTSALAKRLSRDLKNLGFTFVGPVIVYSFLQAVGVVNDHLTTCDWHGDSL